MRRCHRHTLLALLLSLTMGAIARGQQKAPDFTRDVRPVLARYCFTCHGPDDKTRKAKLRLDVPGKLPAAELVARITSSDPDMVMPPPSTKTTLTAQQQDVLRRWVAA